MSDSGCYLLDDGKPCYNPIKREQGSCSGIVYSKERGFQQEDICPYYWFWEHEDDNEADE